MNNAKLLPMISLSFLFISLTMVLFYDTTCRAGQSDKLAGPSFSDPSYRAPLPNNWQKEKIVYESDYNGADIVVTLDQHLYPALGDLIKQYGQNNNLKIVVMEGTCGISAGKLANKQVDIGGFCCPPGDVDRLPGIKFHTLGIAALALLVNSDNPIENLSLDQARKIFMGDISRWTDLSTSKGAAGGLLDLPIEPIGRLHCVQRPGHWRLLLDNEDLFGSNMQEVGTISDMISLVSNRPGAIGYEVLWNRFRYDKSIKLKPLKINDAAPDDSAALLTGQYPLYRVYNITTWGDAETFKAPAKNLANYLLEVCDKLDPMFGIIPFSSLKKARWKFQGDELVGGPEK